MAKRKRDVSEEDGSYNWGDKKLRIQRLRLDQTVQHGVVLLHRALKVARGFERQKLGRREKAARQESDRMLLNRRLNEVEALKALDLHKTAERYLIKQMAKTKRIAESPVFIHLKLAERISNEEKKSDAEANVSARLFNSNPMLLRQCPQSPNKSLLRLQHSSPTLMGGYWSGSESEPEQDYTPTIPERKNRMGQQARRKLWEKKYGSNARHIQKQAKEQAQGKNRDSGWDLRRGATTQEDTRGRYGRNKIRGSQRKEATGSNTAQVQALPPTPKPTPLTNDRPLHPSWQAAIKRKESKTQTSFQGKKVVFD
ncbi:uncharacterized protein TERG_00090 [Trichophyton rubrum CBS 118892]|uniref:Bud22 domain-containing protein n=1 Tax=Trichophyton rubrum (strain ATCC MYA-4607 / CBS 118892) TaxID=559305 RepID=F2SDQ7_TRIRC|nr:uncharacterized protein TERG_00090 [Trichophyton rubrum CBS 118892]EGD83807.2 hypothetical protein TERG_00090 [Trichophyton rubrum CBS 118892]